MQSKRGHWEFDDVTCVLMCGHRKILTLRTRLYHHKEGTQEIDFTSMEDIGLSDQDLMCHYCGLHSENFDIPQQDVVGRFVTAKKERNE